MSKENKLSFEFNPIVRGMKVADSNTLFPIHRVFCVGKNYAEHAKEMGCLLYTSDAADEV